MIRFLAMTRPVLLIVAVLAATLFGLAGFAAAQSPPPEKVEQLIDILSDPAVKAWLVQQTQTPPPAPFTETPPADATSLLSTVLAMIKNHGQTLIEAFPRLPAQFERARNIFLVEFEDRSRLGILALILGFIAAGFGLERLARLALKGYRQWMARIPIDDPRGRLKALAARTLYAFIMIAAFTIGSAGVFLAFEWPPLLREIVLAYLSVAIITCIVLMAGRVVLMPPFLGLPNSEKYRVLPMTDARATHWYIFAGINTAWFTFVSATLSLLMTFGFDVAGRQAIGVVAGFVQLMLLLAAIWLRPPTAGDTPYRISPRTVSWLLTVLFILLWLLWVSGSLIAFWLLFAAVVLPTAVTFTKKAVYHVLRPSDDNSEMFSPVTIAVIDRGLRVCLILAAAFLFVTRAWGVDIFGMTEGGSMSERLLRGGLNAIVIVLAADFGWSVAKALIARKLAEVMPVGHGTTVSAQKARLRTLLPIFQNMLFAVIVVMAVLMTLSSLGIEIGPLIAGAGVVGVAIGFGAQTLVKDVISGMFYLLDDAFRVGEYLVSGNYKGTVESFSLRSVKLRHHRGYLSTVPFGELGAVQNMSRDWVIDKFSVTVDYGTNIEKARKLIKKLDQELAESPEFAPHIIEPLRNPRRNQLQSYREILR